MAYEISKTLDYSSKDTYTPLGKDTSELLDENPVLISILRAGLSLHQGFMNYFDSADCGFISAYRNHLSDDSFNIIVEYLASNSIEDKTLILIDPMLATGQSLNLCFEAILSKGTPKKLIIASVIASPEGIEYLKEKLSSINFDIYIIKIDEELDAHKYIVPGLGDAGDLAYGDKI
jgi:uracil phosphoribosyltransferase